jgi:hypothetical protein
LAAMDFGEEEKAKERTKTKKKTPTKKTHRPQVKLIYFSSSFSSEEFEPPPKKRHIQRRLVDLKSSISIHLSLPPLKSLNHHQRRRHGHKVHRAHREGMTVRKNLCM